jgi:neutral ceramidase
MNRTVFFLVSVVFLMITPSVTRGDKGAAWKAGLARIDITPEQPIWMAGYAARKHPSQGVLARLHAKALLLVDGNGERALLITADLIGFRQAVADMIFERIEDRVGIPRSEILLNPSHTHAGPLVGTGDAIGYGLEDEEAARVAEYTDWLADQLAGLAQQAVDASQPASLLYGVGVAKFVMNRREFTQQGIRLGTNPSGYADRSVPVLMVRDASDRATCVVFGCACHNTTLGGQNYQICGDYAGFAQSEIERQQPELQAMFMTGCGADANPYPRGTVELAQEHGQSLGQEVCRVMEGAMRPVHGPLRTAQASVDLPLAAVSRDDLLRMSAGPNYLAGNAKRMLEQITAGQPLASSYRTSISVWQLGDDLTLVGLPGEVVSEYVPLLQHALGHRNLWVAGYTNDCFGYLPTARILAQGGYETRCLISEPGFFAPEAEDVLVGKVQELAQTAGRVCGD